MTVTSKSRSLFVRYAGLLHIAGAFILLATMALGALGAEGKKGVPERIPPKRSSQIENGLGGVNTSLPRAGRRKRKS